MRYRLVLFGRRKLIIYHLFDLINPFSVSPNMKLCDLRESIERSCGHEDYFPRNFIFLRSVGRCLTRVKPRQESELKVKNYRPPQVKREEKNVDLISYLFQFFRHLRQK